MNKPDPPNVSLQEVRLLSAAAAGDQQAQMTLFEDYRDVAYRTAYRILGNEADALDVVQDAFIRAFGRMQSFRQTSSFKTWLLRITSNRALDVVRSRRVRLAASLDAGDDEQGSRLPADPDAADPSADVEQRELMARVQAAIDRLPEEQKQVIALYGAGDMTYGDIAAALDVPIGTVMSRLHNARKRMREWLGES